MERRGEAYIKWRPVSKVGPYVSQENREHIKSVSTTLIYLCESFQIQSSVSSNYLTSSTDLHMDDLEESNHEANLGTALYILLYTQQILNPLIFLYSEFLAK